jgi:hypothetical protein
LDCLASRGEYPRYRPDIWEDIGRGTKDYGVSITGIDTKTLQSEIADIVGIPYLAKATEAEANNTVEVGHGIVYSRNLVRYFRALLVIKTRLIGFFSSWTLVRR